MKLFIKINKVLFFTRDFFYEQLLNFYYILKVRILNNVVVRSNSFIDIDTFSMLWKHIYIWQNSIITKTKIGNYCSIAPNVSIGLWEHDITKISLDGQLYDDGSSLTQKDCVIWNNVRICVGSIIRRWVNIGDGAVVWANSFVNQDVPPYAVVAWSPAKIIKYRFTDNKIIKIQSSEWRKFNLNDAKKIINQLETDTI